MHVVVRFYQNGVLQPVSGIPASEIGILAPEVCSSILNEILQFIAKWLYFDGPHCIFGQLIFGKIIKSIAIRF